MYERVLRLRLPAAPNFINSDNRDVLLNSDNESTTTASTSMVYDVDHRRLCSRFSTNIYIQLVAGNTLGIERQSLHMLCTWIIGAVWVSSVLRVSYKYCQWSFRHAALIYSFCNKFLRNMLDSVRTRAQCGSCRLCGSVDIMRIHK